MAAIPSRPPIYGGVLSGISWIIVFVAGFSIWSAITPLESAAVAQGAVNLDTYRKTVQHLEGGIIKELLVREGQGVDKGQTLVVLDDTQAKSRIDLLQAVITSLRKQLEYTMEELEDFEALLKDQIVSKTSVLELRRRKVELEGDIIEKMAQLRASRDVHARLSIPAPISGTVVGLQTHTLGGVVKPGEALLSIVSQEERLVVEAQIDPNDIDVIHRNLPAQVRLTPQNARMVPPIAGKVVWVSADRMTNERSGESYYTARVEITELPQDLKDQIDLYPGMPAEIIIATGKRTLLEYLTAPLSRSFRRAFREQ